MAEKKLNFAGFSGTNSRKKRPISREFSRPISLKNDWQKTSDFVEVFRANFAGKRSFLRWFEERDKAFYIVAASQFSATLMWERLVVLGCCLLATLTKFQGKLASLQQVSSPSSQNNFQICCADMYLVRFLANFAGFRVFLWISRDFADLLQIRGSATARNIRSPVKTRRKVLVNQQQWHYHISPQIISFHRTP